ncbi:hypothetical protein VE04_08628 [Pseudogymnoascus sp. 24MN13]|nr:hypothetical protein VE04_08628 [Pseudogymnoascus sp. 24MN13]
MSSLLKKKGAASFKPRAPARRPGVTAPPSASPSIPPVEKQAQAPAPPAAHNVPIPSVEVESPAAPEVQPAPSAEKPVARPDSAVIPPPPKDSAAPATSAKKDFAVIPPLTKEVVQPSITATPLGQESAVPLPSTLKFKSTQPRHPAQPHLGNLGSPGNPGLPLLALRSPERGKSAPRRVRSAVDQEIDHSTIKMADLCKDLKIGKKFSKHDEIKQRDIDRKAKAKLRRENPELVGASDDERPSATTRSATETPIQTTSVGPRMRLVDGQIVIDESSLNLDRHKLAAANAGVMEIIEENEFTRITTSGTFMKREKNIFWDLEAEEKFYVGLRMFGTDFEMISKMFPDRNRRQIKLKFNKEERLYPSKINSALLGEKVPINFDEYKSHTGLEYEDVAVINAEREEIEAEQNAEEARVEAELAEATRQKKAAIHATRGPEGKENDRFGGGSNAAKSKNKGKKKNKASAFGGGEDVEYLGDI